MTAAKGDYSWGPTRLDDGRLRFRLWAPAEQSVTLRLGGDEIAMRAVGEGWFETVTEDRPPGTDYAFILGDGTVVPDPASRLQRDALSPSTLTGPGAYVWQHRDWKGRPWKEAICYELHVGTFTAEGTFRAATSRLAELAEIGFTVIEMMPLAHFPGRRGWGYDGVFQYAPFSPYGSNDDLKAFVDAAHGLGLMVILDVVYNHFGPEGNFLPRYAPDFFLADDPTPWGARIDFSKAPVRRYFIDNAVYWLMEFRMDGLRLDAVDQIADVAEGHFLEEISIAAREAAAGRHVQLVTENPGNDTDLMVVGKAGLPLYDADWNDDFHHALHVAVTGEVAGHYKPFEDDPWANTARALAAGYLKPGAHALAIDSPAASDLRATAFVHFFHNHDQVGNRALGDRLQSIVEPALYRALVEMLVLSPQIPLFFQGDDHLSTRPFRFFADYEGEIRAGIWKHRAVEAENFGGFREGVGPEDLPDPCAPDSFSDCKLDWREAERREAKAWRDFLRGLFATRMREIVPLLGPELRGGGVVEAPDRCLFVDWPLGGGGALKLRANLSPRPVAVEGDCGTVIHASRHVTEVGMLPAHAVRVSMT